MKVVCTQENLKNGLATVGRIISPNNTLPILNNILIKTENGQLKICSTNLEVAISTTIRCKIEEEGGVTVLAKTISDLVNNLPNNNIQLQTNKDQIKIETENYHTTLKTLPFEEFPIIPEVETQETITIDSQQFKKGLDAVIFAASTNQTQPEISGVCLSFENKLLKIVATDRYRLAEKKVSLEQEIGKAQEVIIPHKTAIEISRIISSTKTPIEIILNNTQISVAVAQTQVISRLIDGQYPDYKQIIPQNFSVTVVTEKQSFMNALKAGGIFSQNTSVRLEYNEEAETLTIVAESNDLGKSEVNIPSMVSGQSGQLILNYRYILDALTAIETPKVILKITNDNSPSLIIPEGQETYTYLVMPIKS